SHSAYRLAPGFGVQQSMQVDDEIAHMRVVDRLLRFGLPCHVSGCVVWKHADDVDFIEVFEFAAAKLSEFAPEDEMQQLFFCRARFCGHESISGRWRRRFPLLNSTRIRFHGRARTRSMYHGGHGLRLPGDRMRPSAYCISAVGPRSPSARRRLRAPKDRP